MSDKKQQNLMYVGPTLRGVATYGTVYTRIPDPAREARSVAPQFLNLFIPVIKYGTADLMIRSQKGYIFEAYKEAGDHRSEIEALARKGKEA